MSVKHATAAVSKINYEPDLLSRLIEKRKKDCYLLPNNVVSSIVDVPWQGIVDPPMELVVDNDSNKTRIDRLAYVLRFYLEKAAMEGILPASERRLAWAIVNQILRDIDAALLQSHCRVEDKISVRTNENVGTQQAATAGVPGDNETKDDTLNLRQQSRSDASSAISRSENNVELRSEYSKDPNSTTEISIPRQDMDVYQKQSVGTNEARSATLTGDFDRTAISAVIGPNTELVNGFSYPASKTKNMSERPELHPAIQRNVSVSVNQAAMDHVFDVEHHQSLEVPGSHNLSEDRAEKTSISINSVYRVPPLEEAAILASYSSGLQRARARGISHRAKNGRTANEQRVGASSSLLTNGTGVAPLLDHAPTASRTVNVPVPSSFTVGGLQIESSSVRMNHSEEEGRVQANGESLTSLSSKGRKLNKTSNCNHGNHETGDVLHRKPSTDVGTRVAASEKLKKLFQAPIPRKNLHVQTATATFENEITVLDQSSHPASTTMNVNSSEAPHPLVIQTGKRNDASRRSVNPQSSTSSTGSRPPLTSDNQVQPNVSAPDEPPTIEDKRQIPENHLQQAFTSEAPSTRSAPTDASCSKAQSRTETVEMLFQSDKPGKPGARSFSCSLQVRDRMTRVWIQRQNISEEIRSTTLERLKTWDPFWEPVTTSYTFVERTRKVLKTKPPTSAHAAATAGRIELELNRLCPFVVDGVVCQTMDSVPGLTWGKHRSQYNDGDHAVLLRMLGSTMNIKSRSDNHLWPKGTFLQIDGKPTVIKQRIQQSHDLTEWKGMCALLDLCEHISNPKESHKIQFCCYDNKIFNINIQLCRYRSVDSLYRTLTSSIGLKVKPSQEGIALAGEYAQSTCVVLEDGDSDQEGAGSLCFSLVCPISKLLLETPVRGSCCKHFQCFDLRTFLAANSVVSGSRWRCGVCEKFVPLGDLEICGFTCNLLGEFKSVASTVRDRVELRTDETYRLLDERKEKYGRKRSVDKDTNSTKRMKSDIEEVVID